MMRAHAHSAVRSRGFEPEDRPLSVLQIVTCRGWSSDAWNAVALCKGLQLEGHRVLLLCRRVAGGRAVAERARRSGVQEVDFFEGSNNFRPASYFRDGSLLWRMTRDRSLDVIHLHRGMEHWLSAVAFFAKKGPVLIRSRHILRRVKRHPFNRWLYRYGTDRVITVCERIRKGYLDDGVFPPGRFATVMGGADASAYDPSGDGASFRTAHAIPASAWVIGVAGSLRMWMKGQDVLLRAAAEFRRRGEEPPWILLVGKGEDLDRLKSLAEELGIGDRTVFSGYVERLADAFAACNVLAFPSRRPEGTSRVLFECLASGRPVVASRVGCTEEIVRDGVDGILVRPSEVADLHRALARIRRDPAFASAMGASARRRAVEEFDLGEMARRTVGVYREAIRARRESVR